MVDYVIRMVTMAFKSLIIIVHRKILPFKSRVSIANFQHATSDWYVSERDFEKVIANTQFLTGNFQQAIISDRQFALRNSRSPISIARFSIGTFQYTILDPQFLKTIHDQQFSIHNSLSAVFNAQFLIGSFQSTVLDRQF